MAAQVSDTYFDGSLIEGLAIDLLQPNSPSSARRPNGWMVDSEWVKQSFIVGTDTSNKPFLEPVDQQNRSFSTASIKFTDTSLGGNICINPPPQFTRYADPPLSGVLKEAVIDVSLGLESGHLGMGPYYSEAIDDNNQIIHLRFGVPQFNSLTQFFTGFYSSAAGTAARTGRFNQGFISQLLSTAGNILALALVPLVIIPVGLLMLGSAARFFFKAPSSSFYSMKPTMPMYWNAVTALVNQLAVNQRIVTYFDDEQATQILGDQKFSNRDMSIFSALTDGGISDKGVIDVYRLANRAKRLEMRFESMRAREFENASGDETYFGVVKRAVNSATDGVPDYEPPPLSLETLIDRMINGDGSTYTAAPTGDTDGAAGIEGDPRKVNMGGGANGEDDYSTPPEVTENGGGFLNMLIANLADGGEFASFRVDYTGAVQESFSSNTAESSLAGKLNGIAAQSHEVRMNYAGAIESIPGLSTVVDGVKGAIGAVASTLHLEGLAAFAGSAFVNIPQHWESSVAQLPHSTYTMTLSSPYGNPISRMFSIYIPLAMIMAGALPLSTGKQSHTSPFLVELHDKGRAITRLGIIDSLSISRGTGNIGFTKEGFPLSIEVTFTIKDLSSIMALPIQPGFSSMPFSGLFDGENAFTDYLMALSGMSLRDSIYPLQMFKYQVKRKIAELSTFTSASHMASYTASLPGVSALAALMRGTTR